MKIKLLISLLLLTTPIPILAMELATIAGLTAQFPSGCIYTLYQLRGNFSLSFTDYKPHITLRPGIHGLGFVTNRQGFLQSQDSDLHMIIKGEHINDLDPEQVLFTAENNQQVVPLSLLYAYVKGELSPDEDTVKNIEKVITLFFAGSRKLTSCTYSNVLGRRDQNIMSSYALYLILFPPVTAN